MKDSLTIHPLDNVAVALRPLCAGEEVAVPSDAIRLRSDVRAGHKFTLRDLKKGEDVVKYGFPIGHLAYDVVAGTEVDDRVIRTNLGGLLEYEWHPAGRGKAEEESRDAESKDTWPMTDGDDTEDILTFDGYLRRNGEAGVRNEVWVVPTVGCVNGVAKRLATAMQARLDRYPGVERVVAFGHPYGCSQLGDDHEDTRHILRDVVLHPNAGGVLVVGLGCENNQPHDFMDTLGNYNRERIRLLVCQEAAGDEMEEGLRLLGDICEAASTDRRTRLSLRLLRVGLKCGGSDGFSGITANPLVGRFSDWLTARGGTTVLTEVPEMFGAETLLMNRCASRELFERTVRMINDFKQYYLSHGLPVGENPSPGNKAGGISTLEEKALGCTQKSGTSLVRGVLDYGQRLEGNGLHLLNAPGNDLVATTALAASGCQLVLFTTGRGTPFGTFVPTIKVSTNSQLHERKPGWIDFNAGTLAEDEDFESVLPRFVAKVLRVASGEATCNERSEYQEIAIWKNGVTL